MLIRYDDDDRSGKEVVQAVFTSEDEAQFAARLCRNYLSEVWCSFGKAHRTLTDARRGRRYEATDAADELPERCSVKLAKLATTDAADEVVMFGCGVWQRLQEWNVVSASLYSNAAAKAHYKALFK